MKHKIIVLCTLLLLLGCNKKAETKGTTTVLPSWNEGTTKESIISYVEKTTKEGGPDYIPVEDRIACFDNDGTLWTEQPIYFQLAFVFDEIKRMSSKHPEWKTEEPFKYVLTGDTKSILAGGKASLVKLLMATHANMATEDFQYNVSQWLKTAKHSKTGMSYDGMVYQPMLELINYLKANNFKVFIVSGGGVDFMRVWAPAAYGIPTDQIIGSSVVAEYVIDYKGTPEIVKLPELDFFDDKNAKPVGIWQHIGKQPVFAFGNSDGDYQMLEYTTSGKGYPRFGGIVHHTDSIREYAYDRKSPIGQLEKGLDDAAKKKWIVVDMKNDWNKIYRKEQ